MKKTAEIPVKDRNKQTPVQRTPQQDPKNITTKTPGKVQPGPQDVPTSERDRNTKQSPQNPPRQDGEVRRGEGRSNLTPQEPQEQGDQRNRNADEIRRKKDPTANPQQPGQKPDWPDVHSKGTRTTRNTNAPDEPQENDYPDDSTHPGQAF